MIDALKRRLRSFLNRNNAVVLTYHSVLPEPLAFPLWHNLSLEKFEQHAAILARDFRCVALSELLRDIARGQIRPNTVAVTFDDGFRSNLTHVLPVLKQYQVPATLFVTTGFVGGRDLLWPEWLACALAHSPSPVITFAGQASPLGNIDERVNSYRALIRVFKQFKPAEMPGRINDLLHAAAVTRQDIEQSSTCNAFSSLTWDEIGTLRDSGLFEFGAHTVSHWRLSNLSAAEARHEIAESKRQLEAHVGHVQSFAYPHGGTTDFDSSHRDIAIDAGFEAIFTAMTGIVNANSDRFALPRFGIGGEITQDQFSYMMHGGVARLGS